MKWGSFWMKIKVDKQFEKDLRKANLKSKIISKLFTYISMLTNEESLPLEARDHALKGELEGFREFHLSGDMLVIYMFQEDDLIFVRLGTHSQLFKSM